MLLLLHAIIPCFAAQMCFTLALDMQILMNVRLVQATVVKSVPTLKAPSSVPVTVDIDCQVMEDHAMVREYTLKRVVSESR